MKSNHSFFIIFYTFKSLFPKRILACFTFFIFLKMRLKINENNENNENFKRRELFFYKSDFYGFGGKKFLRFCRKKLPDEIFFTNVEAEIFKILTKKVVFFGQKFEYLSFYVSKKDFVWYFFFTISEEFFDPKTIKIGFIEKKFSSFKNRVNQMVA